MRVKKKKSFSASLSRGATPRCDTRLIGSLQVVSTWISWQSVMTHMCNEGTLGVVLSSLRAYCYFHFLEEEVINGGVGD